MNKSLIKIIVFLILLIFFINGFSASFTSHDISNLAYVLALGIDIGENAKLKISAQFSTPDASSSDSKSSEKDSGQIVLVSGEADSIFSGLSLINSYIGKELNLAHCNLIVFSEDFAKQGIATQIYSFINNEEIRPSTNILISKCDAYDYLDNVKPSLEKITVQYYDTFSISNRLTGYFENITIGDFYNKLSSKATCPVAILGGLDVTARNKKSSEASSSSDMQAGSDPLKSENIIINTEDLIAGSSSIEGKLGIENIGLAIFKENKLCGELTAMETICHLLITDSLDSCVISIDDPFRNSEKAELSISPKSKSKITIIVKDGIPHISVKLSVDAYGLTLDENTNYETHNSVELFSKTAKEYLEKQFNNYFNKVSKEYGTDIDYFATKALVNFSTMGEWEEYNWPEKFKEAQFDISIDVNLISSLLVTKT